MLFRTACSLNCWDTCTILAEVKGGKVSNLRGDPEHPVTSGFVCPKAHYQLLRMYSPDRLVRPVVRTKGGWRSCSWQHALALIAERVSEAVARHGSQSVYYHSDSGSMGYLHSLRERFFNLLGGVTLPAGSLCWAAGIAAQHCDFGYHLANDALDVVNARTIVLWGRDPAHTNIHLLPLLHRAKERGATVIVVDPVRTKSADLADVVVQLRPRTDAALALALANLLATRGKVDVEFVSRHTYGYDVFRSVAFSMSAVKASEITGVSVGEIEQLATLLCARPVAFMLGYGVQRHRHGAKTVRAIDALGAVCGSIGISGGGVNYANGYVKRQLADLRMVESGVNARYVTRVNFADQIERLSPPVQVAFFAGTNVLAQNPDANSTRRALSRLPFKVCLDLCMTDTAKECDVVLPVATFLEQENIYFCSWHNFVTFSPQVVPPLGECRPDWQVFSALAAELGLKSMPSLAGLEWIEKAIKPQVDKRLLPDAKHLIGQSIRFPDAPQVAWEDGRFETPSGKFEFYSGIADEADPGCGVCAWVEPECASDKHLHLVSRRHLHHLHSQFYDRVSCELRCEVFVSPYDLHSRSLNDRQVVKLKNSYGEMKAVLRVDDTLRPGVAHVYEGGSLSDGKCVNVLTPPGPTDLGLGSRYADCFIEIEAGEE